MNRLTDLKELIRYGIQAPSGHNTQPWLFSVQEDAIHIHPDFSRALPVVDSDHHALYISLGCAAENIVITASKYGLHAEVDVKEKGDGSSFINIILSADESVPKDELIEYIEERQSTRNEYNDQKVPAHDLKALENSFHFNGIEMVTLTGRDEIKNLEPLIIEGSNLQFQSTDFVEELISWFRFSKKEADSKGDGLWAKCMGLPPMNRFIGNIVMKYFVSAKSEAKRWKNLIDSSAGFALFLTENNDAAHWIWLGRAFQRFGLTATKLGISHAHVNMPCEELETRQKLVNKFDLGSQHPLLLIRFGYSEKMPYSFRRDVSQVIRSN